MARNPRYRRMRRAGFLVAAILAWAPNPFSRPQPSAWSVDGPWRPVPEEDARVFFDVTGKSADTGERILHQTVFDEVLRRIRRAEQFIVLDFFLWNDWGGGLGEPPRSLARELADALLTRKRQIPGMEILALTDPINRLYGNHAPQLFRELTDAGIHVLFTDVSRLPESNVPFGRPASRLEPLLSRLPGLDLPLAPNPIDPKGQKLSLRETARLLRFKANHRKALISDDAGRLGLLVTSFNPAGGSWAHGNLAMTASGAVAFDALESELALMEAALSGPYADSVPDPDAARRAATRVRDTARRLAQAQGDSIRPGGPRVRWITEAAVPRAIEDILSACRTGDEVAVMMFYLSDRGVIRALIRAAKAGARVRVILDLNRDAFGRVKNGIPNRPVAAELMDAGRRMDGRLEVRWALTQGEQFHTKAMAVRGQDGRRILLGGSANWTRRNLRDLNLEANLVFDNASGPVAETFEYFDRMWNNDGLLHTRAYADHAETGWTRIWKTAVYRIQEATGACTF